MTNKPGSEHVVHVDLGGEARTETQPETDPEIKLCVERANQDIQTANDTARGALQAAILINGGAATAILAYLSKGTQTATSLTQAASWALAGYAVGALLAAASMWWQTQALAQFGHHHETKARALLAKAKSAEKEEIEKLEKEAGRRLWWGNFWLWGHRIWISVSVVFFLASSVYLAYWFHRTA